jgi:polysaccharide biosynthesis protein PslH
MRGLIRYLLETEKIDVIHADQLTMTQFALPDSNTGYPESEVLHTSQMIKNETNGSRALRDWPVLIFDAHNAVWTIVERMRRSAPWLLKPLAALETRRIKRYEGMIVHNFDYTLAVTEPDSKALLEAAFFYDPSVHVHPGRITVVPIAVDTNSTQPVRRPSGSANILTLGTLHYLPNADGIRWFLKEVFPLIRRDVPQASLTIVGKNPPQDFLLSAASSAGAIVVTGYVPDLTPHLEEAALMVVPVRAGGGMRVRILEAFARGMPVVTTTVGLEGIEARPGEDVLVADTPAEFSERVVELLDNEQLRARLSANGRRLVETTYDWQVVLKKMHEMYREVENERARGATSHG